MIEFLIFNFFYRKILQVKKITKPLTAKKKKKKKNV